MPAPTAKQVVDRGLVGSIGRIGDCFDDSVAQTFFANLRYLSPADHEHIYLAWARPRALAA